MAKEAILEIEKAEKNFENLIETEKEELKTKLNNVIKQLELQLNEVKQRNDEEFEKFVQNFMNDLEARSTIFKQKVEDECLKMEDELNKNVNRAVDLILTKFLKN